MQQVELLNACRRFVPDIPSFMYDSKHIVNTKPGEEMWDTDISAWGIFFKVENKKVFCFFRMTIFFSPI